MTSLSFLFRPTYQSVPSGTPVPPRRTISRVFPCDAALDRYYTGQGYDFFHPSGQYSKRIPGGRVLQRRIIRAYVARHGSVCRLTIVMGSRGRLTSVELPDACARPGATGRDGAAGRRRYAAPSWPASNDHKPRPGRRSNWKICGIWDIREAQAAPLRERSDHVHWRAAQPTSRTLLPRSPRSVREIARV